MSHTNFVFVYLHMLLEELSECLFEFLVCVHIIHHRASYFNRCNSKQLFGCTKSWSYLNPSLMLGFKPPIPAHDGGAVYFNTIDAFKAAGLAQWAQKLATRWTLRGSKCFVPRGQHNLLWSGCRVFPGVKRPKLWMVSSYSCASFLFLLMRGMDMTFLKCRPKHVMYRGLQHSKN